MLKTCWGFLDSLAIAVAVAALDRGKALSRMVGDYPLPTIGAAFIIYAGPQLLDQQDALIQSSHGLGWIDQLPPVSVALATVIVYAHYWCSQEPHKIKSGFAAVIAAFGLAWLTYRSVEQADTVQSTWNSC